jgi:hypothetical protein
MLLIKNLQVKIIVVLEFEWKVIVKLDTVNFNIKKADGKTLLTLFKQIYQFLH